MKIFDKIKFKTGRYAPYFEFWARHSRAQKTNFVFRQKRNEKDNEMPVYKEIEFSVPAETATGLFQLVHRNDTALFVCLVTSISILLKRYSGESNIIINSPLLKADMNKDIYADKVSLLLEVNEDFILKELLNTINAAVKECYSYQNYPMQLLEDESNKEVFNSNVLITFDKIHHIPSSVSDKYDLLIDIKTDHSDWVAIKFLLNENAYDAFLIENISLHFEQVLSCFKTINFPVREIDILSKDERQNILKEFNRTEKFFPKEKTIQQLFEERAAITPDNNAIFFAERVLSYKELNEKANQLAHHLRSEYAIVPDMIVGLLMERSEWMIIGMMAILKAGAAYLPIDPQYPQSRIEYLLEDSGAELILTEKKLVQEYVKNLNWIDIEKPSLYKEIVDNPVWVNTSADLAYLIYTSGSTGQPKGVEVMHQSVVNFLLAMAEAPGMKEGDRILAVTTYTFDISVLEIFLPLVTGAAIHLLSREDIYDPLRLKEQIERNKPTILQATPAMWSMLVNVGWQGTKDLKILVGGEALNKELAGELLSRSGSVWNMYGPTETTVWSTFKKIEQEDDSLLIGKPVANTRVFILDENQRPVPIGIPGEIYIGASGLAKGYHNLRELTDEKFITNLFGNFEKLYRTGDIGRWQINGDIEFLGRKDSQVKIRGFRIEPGEIENTLLGYEKIKNAVVVLDEKSEKNEKQLLAYVTSDEHLTKKELIHFLEERLPAYMIPSLFIQLDSFPQTFNGKIDRKALPNTLQNILSDGEAFEAPRNEIERQLLEIWKEVLRKDKISIHDNFFALGGHSLKATQVVSSIYKEMFVQMELRQIFSYPTIEALAKLIPRSGKINFEPINPVIPQEHYGLSYSQRRLWVLDQFDQARTAYNIPVAFILEGDLNRSAFEHSIEALVERHESLRTTFIIVDGEPRQQIHDYREFNFRVEYLDWKGKQNQEGQAEDWVYTEVNTSFNLEMGPLLRAKLLHLDDDKYLFILTVHHIIADVWSMGVIVKETLALYEAYAAGNNNPLAPLKIQYKDYADWQQKKLSGENLRKHREYWLGQFQEEIPVLHLSTDFLRPAVKTYHGNHINFVLDKEMSQGLSRIALEQDSTLFMTLLSGITVLLHRYTGQDDIIIGSPIAGRDHKDLEDQVGFFINNLPLRIRFNKRESFEKLLRNVKEVTLQGYEHQAYPYDLLVNELNLNKDTSRSPLFDVVVVLQNTGDGTAFATSSHKLSVKNVETRFTASQADLRIVFNPLDEALVVSFEYNTDLFTSSRIKKMTDHFKGIVKALINGYGGPIATLEYMSAGEKEKLLHGFNDSNIPFPQSKTIHELFEEQSSKHPDKIAISGNGQTLTYAELNEKSNRLAHYLRENYQVEKDNIIAIMIHHSEWAIIAILGILKSGAAYLPIDPDYPEERKNYILSDARPKLLLTESAFLFSIQNYQCSLLALDIQFTGMPDKIINPPVINSSDDLAYIIYTSGSTGQPKGVVIEHRSSINMSLYQLSKFSITADDKVLQFASLAFDASVSEILMALLAGAGLVLMPESLAGEADDFINYLEKESVSVVTLPPSYLSVLNLQRLLFLRVLITAGEPVIAKDLLYCSSFCDCFNAYGPTECAVCVTIHKVNAEDAASDFLSIGKPISNMSIYILDENLLPVPIGVAGEIYVAGIGLARGYLNRNELTDERFLENPFDQDQRIYKTGDTGLWLENGEIKFVGRNDDQVKIRGYRIEPGEIRNVLLKNETIEDAVVIAREEKGDKYLVAYFILKEGYLAQDLQNYLTACLPEYMIPSYFVALEAFPLTSNGKINKKALPSPVETHSGQIAYVAPRNPLEDQLAIIWGEVLGRENVGIYDNFFEIGGHSLKAVQVVSRIHKELNVKIELKNLFVNPSIEYLAQRIASSHVQQYQEIEPVPQADHYKVSHSQKRLWIIDQLQKGGINYNIPAAYLLHGKLDIDAFERSFENLVKRHESLRTTFISIEGEPRQEIRSFESFGFKIDYEDLRQEKDNEERAKSLAHKEANTPFSLAKGPLLRVKLLRLKDSTYLFLLTMHHIISDAWSMEVLVKEMLVLYRAYCSGEVSPLAPLRIQYKDYAAWQHSQLSGESIKAYQQYWWNELSGEIPRLDVPLDFPRPSVKTFSGNYSYFLLNPEITTGLRKLKNDYGTGMFVCLLGAVKALLYRYTGSEDIIIGTPVAGRDHFDLENQVGFYVNNLALRTRFNHTDTFRQLLLKVKENVLNAFNHQLYPFDMLVNDLAPETGEGRFPFFDVVVVFENGTAIKDDNAPEDISIENYDNNFIISNMDMKWIFQEKDDEIVGIAEYNTGLFKPETINDIIENFITAIHAFTINPELKLNEIDLKEQPYTEPELVFSTNFNF